MNLIANRHLDGAQKQVIYELTLKKRQSKKSTMSDRQRAAKQQLAKELMLERRTPPSLGSISGSQHTIDSFAISACISTSSNSGSDSMSHADRQSLLSELLPATNNSSPSSTGVGTCRTCCCKQLTTKINNNNPSSHLTQLQQQPQQTVINTPIAVPSAQQLTDDSPPPSSPGFAATTAAASGCGTRSSCASCSFTRSDSSYSGSSASIITADSNNSIRGSDAKNLARHNVNEGRQHTHLAIESNDNNIVVDADHDPFREARKKEASVKVHKLKLEHLNFELERKLHQYEYLVAQEKALLGTYNMMLFTNQGVNNFHLHRNI